MPQFQSNHSLGGIGRPGIHGRFFKADGQRAISGFA